MTSLPTCGRRASWRSSIRSRRCARPRRGRPVSAARRRRRCPAAWSSTKPGAAAGSDSFEFCASSPVVQRLHGLVVAARAGDGHDRDADADGRRCNGINEREWQCLPTDGHVTLNVVMVDSKTGATTPVTDFKWTLQEDRTYRVVPGVIDPNTHLAPVPPELHAGHRVRLRRRACVTPSGPDDLAGPVVQRQPARCTPTGRYFISVLPGEQGPFNGGSPIAAGQSGGDREADGGSAADGADSRPRLPRQPPAERPVGRRGSAARTSR